MNKLDVITALKIYRYSTDNAKFKVCHTFHMYDFPEINESHLIFYTFLLISKYKMTPNFQ